MAELFGVAAGAAGFVSFLAKIISGIDTLREISKRVEKAPDELSTLMVELTCLQRLIKEVIDKDPSNTDFMLHLCYASCERVVRGLEKLKKRVPIEWEGTGKQKVLKIFSFRHWKEDVEDLQRSIQDAKMNLILVNTRRTSLRIEEIVLSRIRISSPPISNSEGNILTNPSLPPNPVPDSSNDCQAAIIRSPPSKLRRRWDCAERQCSCSCHRTARTARRFWSLEYTPLHVFGQACSNKSCNATKYGGKISFALSQFGIQWAAAIQFHILATPGKFLFRPALEVERIVPYTSPGFETLWRCERGLITVDEARDRLVDLYRSDPTFKNHVNPAGISYIEELVIAPWRPRDNSEQFELIELFMREFGMTRGTQSTMFLAKCASWNEDDCHVELLELLLDLGFDATSVDLSYTLDWPETEDTSIYAIADPFFIRFQRFADLTPLHEAVLVSSSESVNQWIARSDKDEKNCLGQTPIHLAISNFQSLVALINGGHNINAKDNEGKTPLMYAAAANQEECVIALLEANAIPHILDIDEHNFMEYAAAHEHWNLVFKVLCWMEATTEKEIAEGWAQYATHLYYVTYGFKIKKEEVSFQQLLAKCGSVNFRIDDCYPPLPPILPAKSLPCNRLRPPQNNTLLHYVKSVEDIDILLEHDFTLLNQVNNAGEHALMSVASSYWCKADVIGRLVDAGAEVNLKDNLQRTTLGCILEMMRFAWDDRHWQTMHSVRILLNNGADILCRDSRRCPCSPKGCLPSALLGRRVSECYRSVAVWLLEWLSLVIEYHSSSAAKIVLLQFIRQAKFDELEMTHTCCWSFSTPSISDDDINEILEEEAEFVEILESEMALSSSKAYEMLLDDWILQIKALLEKSWREVTERNKKHSGGKAGGYFVDHKNDCFNYVSPHHELNPARWAICDTATYIRWMEFEYHHESTLSFTKLQRDDWYSMRFSWLHRFICALEISPTEIVDRMRDEGTPNKGSKYESIDIEVCIRHFSHSWDLYEKRQVSPVSLHADDG